MKRRKEKVGTYVSVSLGGQVDPYSKQKPLLKDVAIELRIQNPSKEVLSFLKKMTHPFICYIL